MKRIIYFASVALFFSLAACQHQQDIAPLSNSSPEGKGARVAAKLFVRAATSNRGGGSLYVSVWVSGAVGSLALKLTDSNGRLWAEKTAAKPGDQYATTLIARGYTGAPLRLQATTPTQGMTITVTP